MINDTFVIDMQHHYIPPEALKLVGKTTEYDFTMSITRWGSKVYQTMTDIDEHLKWMDESQIDMAILSTAAFSANGHNFCKVCNDGYSEVIKQYPDRFKGMIHVYPFEKAKSENEIKRGVDELGLSGIAVVTSYQNMAIDSDVMHPIYDMAIKYDMPIFVHPAIRINLWGGERYDLFSKLSREYDIAKSFVEIVYGVLPRFPELKVIMAHLGGGLPALKARIVCRHRPKAFSLHEEDLSHALSYNQAKELGIVSDFESRIKNIFFDSAGCGGWLPVMKFAIETLGSNHICFGTDYPYEYKQSKYVKETINEIAKLDVSVEDKEKFLGGNVKKLFRITK